MYSPRRLHKTKKGDPIEEALSILAIANDHEDKNEIPQAFDNYMHAVSLLETEVQRLQNPPIAKSHLSPKRRSKTQKGPADCDVIAFLEDKIDHYTRHAYSLNAQLSPRSTTGSRVVANAPLITDIESPVETLTLSMNEIQFSLASVVSDISSVGSFSTMQDDEEFVSRHAAEANLALSRALELDGQEKWPEAMAQYIEASESLFKAIGHLKKIEGNEMSTTRKQLTARLKNIISRAEQIKKAEKEVFTVPTTSVHEPPSIHHADSSERACPSSQSLSAEEVQVLKNSSLIASKLVLPWHPEEMKNFDFSSSPGRFNDPDGLLKLSSSQSKRFDSWMRPSEIIQFRGDSSVKPVMVNSLTPHTIRQKHVTDCSFVASLCICAAYERKFQKPLVTSLIYPQDANRRPVYNPHGKYVVKLWLNGVARRVIVDDRLPVDKRGDLICSHTMVNSVLELWVSIIEKAYMKLCGGYDFPGSNSGVDLFALTGWIPERLFMAKDESNVKDFETSRERAWNRIVQASNFGDCLVTVSTAKDLSEKLAEEMGLVSGHAYAVLNALKTGHGIKLLQLKNPWAHTGWKGPYSCHDQLAWSDENLRRELAYDPTKAALVDDGVFWIRWEDLLVNFPNVHLSWNPALFSCKRILHGFWPFSQGPIDDTYNVSENPQYIITLSDKAMKQKSCLYLLLTRHVAKQEQEGEMAKDFLTLHIHRNTSNRDAISYPSTETCLMVGAYTNNPHNLLRYDISEESPRHLSLVLSQHQKANDVAYTLSCYGTADFTIEKPLLSTPAYLQTVHGQWTEESPSGGNPAHDSFRQNPTYSVIIPSIKNGSANIQIKCLAPKSLPVNIMLLKIGTDGDVRLKKENIVLETGDYRRGFVCSSVQRIASGSYSLIVSTYSPGETGNFILELYSSIPNTSFN